MMLLRSWSLRSRDVGHPLIHASSKRPNPRVDRHPLDLLQQRLKQPLKPDQLAGLLDALLEDGRQDLWLAVALVGYFHGLRPSELAVLTVENGKGYVGSIKRNPTSISQPPKPPRRVMPLEIEGRNGEGARALELFGRVA